MGKLQLPKNRSQSELNRLRTYETQKLMEDNGYNPIEAMMALAQDDTIVDPEFKFNCHKELAKYYSPQLRAVDVSGGMDNSMKITVINFSQQPTQEKLVQDEQAKIASGDNEPVDAEFEDVTNDEKEDDGTSDTPAVETADVPI